ncbi:MAG: pyridoxamine 5'-phosphate oxidase family protein [Parvibaculaceae bacterium]|nr:pyridoxamine 5'-phosphate oxidase family protein [Parvibaculaceae bacterium]
MNRIQSIKELEALYGTPVAAATVKELPHLTPDYRALMQASPFAALATSGPDGLDCSPRGDPGHVVHIENDTTLIMPDRRGNNRMDSLRNIVQDPRVALLFLIPGSGTTLRVNGRAHLCADSEQLSRFEIEGKAPRSLIIIEIEAVYFQCARAIHRAKLWEPAAQPDPASIPTPGAILANVSNGEVGGKKYDDGWSERAKDTMW